MGAADAGLRADGGATPAWRSTLRSAASGREGNSFETIVGVGAENGAEALTTGRPGRVGVLSRATSVVFDFGALVDGYCSDMTRTVMVGTASPTQQRMLDVVTASQAAGVATVRAGATSVEVDEACRDDTSRLDAERLGTDLGGALVTTVEQTLLDLAHRPDVGSVPDEAHAAVRALWPRADASVLEQLAGEQRLRAALRRARTWTGR